MSAAGTLPIPTVLDYRHHTFLATGLRQESELDLGEGEDIHSLPLTLVLLPERVQATILSLLDL
jgi:hypothetical protein